MRGGGRGGLCRSCPPSMRDPAVTPYDLQTLPPTNLFPPSPQAADLMREWVAIDVADALELLSPSPLSPLHPPPPLRPQI